MHVQRLASHTCVACPRVPPAGGGTMRADSASSSHRELCGGGPDPDQRPATGIPGPGRQARPLCVCLAPSLFSCRAPPQRVSMHVRLGDTVAVIAGSDKGKVGKVVAVNTKRGDILVEGVNIKVRVRCWGRCCGGRAMGVWGRGRAQGRGPVRGGTEGGEEPGAGERVAGQRGCSWQRRGAVDSLNTGDSIGSPPHHSHRPLPRPPAPAARRPSTSSPRPRASRARS